MHPLHEFQTVCHVRDYDFVETNNMRLLVYFSFIKSYIAVYSSGSCPECCCRVCVCVCVGGGDCINEKHRKIIILYIYMGLCTYDIRGMQI